MCIHIVLVLPQVLILSETLKETAERFDRLRNAWCQQSLLKHTRRQKVAQQAQVRLSCCVLPIATHTTWHCNLLRPKTRRSPLQEAALDLASAPDRLGARHSGSGDAGGSQVLPTVDCL